MIAKFKNIDESVNIGFFLLLCAKFYYLWGLVDSSTSTAPLVVILVRDVLVLGFLLYFGFKVWRQAAQLRFFWMIWLIGLGISCIHLFSEKSWEIWGQHYWRNVLQSLLFYPVFYGLFKNNRHFAVNKILVWVLSLTMIVSLYQLLHLRMARPTGIFGDPIINTIMIAWGTLSLVSFVSKKLYIPVILLVLPVLFFTSAMTALISVFVGVAIEIGLSYQLWKHAIKKVLILTIVSISVTIGGFWLVSEYAVTHKLQYNSDALFVKTSEIMDAITCEGEGCNNSHWSYRGRVWSNQYPIELCRQNSILCLFGQYKNPSHIRLESTWGFLAVNWGLLFCLLYLAWILSHLRGLRKRVSSPNNDLNLSHLWNVIFFSSMVFLIFNTIVHKYPVNILFYASMAYLQFRREENNEIQTRD